MFRTGHGTRRAVRTAWYARRRGSRTTRRGSWPAAEVSTPGVESDES